MLAAIHITKVLGGHQSDTVYENWQGEIPIADAHEEVVETSQLWHWESTSWMPATIERYIESAATTRAGLISYGLNVKAKSMIDQDITPQNIYEVAAYLPRAYQVALFAPFPTSWF